MEYTKEKRKTQKIYIRNSYRNSKGGAMFNNMFGRGGCDNDCGGCRSNNFGCGDCTWIIILILILCNCGCRIDPCLLIIILLLLCGCGCGSCDKKDFHC